MISRRHFWNFYEFVRLSLHLAGYPAFFSIRYRYLATYQQVKYGIRPDTGHKKVRLSGLISGASTLNTNAPDIQPAGNPIFFYIWYRYLAGSRI
jgi:hypothetical protein